MYCVVPLAGPDFYQPSYGIKCLFEVDGIPLIKKTLNSRKWVIDGELNNDSIIFVLRDVLQASDVELYLKNEFAGCYIVKVSNLTKGALLSALAGVSLIMDFTRPLIVDLIDIIYKSDFSPTKIFSENLDIAGILPYFMSNKEGYSYLEISDGIVRQTVEKRVISNHASAGTYFYRNISTFLTAVLDSINFDQIYGYNNNLFLCPSFNGIIRNNGKILPVSVDIIKDISSFFHTK